MKTKNKKRLIFVLAISILFFAIEINAAAILDIKILKYEPYPVQPGEHFTLWVQLENKGSDEAKDATCILDLKYPFSLYSGEAKKSYGMLTKQAVLNYELKADENAAVGENALEIKCTDDPSLDRWLIKNFTIKIQTRYATLNVKTKTIPPVIAPGERAKILFELENNALSQIKDVTLKLDFSSVSIAPYESTTQKKINKIDVNSSEEIVFDIAALPDASAGIYKIPLALKYTDMLGKEYNESTIIGIEIGAIPDIYVVVDSSTISKSEKIGDVVIKIVNKGLVNIKLVNIQLLQNEKYKILSTDNVYVGDVDSDEYGTAEFKLRAKTSKDIILPLLLTYRDANNNLYSEQINKTLVMLTASELGKGSKTTSIIIIILLVVAAYFFYRYKKKRKK